MGIANVNGNQQRLAELRAERGESALNFLVEDGKPHSHYMHTNCDFVTSHTLVCTCSCSNGTQCHGGMLLRFHQL